MLNLPWRLPLSMRREVATLGMLTGLAVVLLIGVTALSELFHSQQDALADRWSNRAASDLAAGDYKAAESDYRTALRYTRDGYSQQLGLAEALIGQRHINQASVYLENLWEQQPENGVVNRELARIAAGKHDTRNALRYYHNAIYATWGSDAEAERQATRWELIKYLLSIKALAQAQSELISLGAEVGDNPAQQLNLGQYFLKVQDGQHALAAFRIVLRAAPHNAAALGGAGEAAFDLGDYPLAQRYLFQAIQQNPADKDSASLLEVTSEVARQDPFRPEISDAERDQAVLSAFQTAGERLKDCPALANLPESPANPAATPATPPVSPGKPRGVLGTIAAALGKLPASKAKAQGPARTPQTAQKQPQAPVNTTPAETLAAAWAQLEPKVTVRELRHNQDVVNEAMNLAFNIERQAALQCGPGTAADTALLLISKLHEGS
ncbi:MAG TPA: tetratricopeptide repeat protein [Terracidiphilus sp.]|nr:tetratricopeptide repeat protein [Terracidiphilus sp.]